MRGWLPCRQPPPPPDIYAAWEGLEGISFTIKNAIIINGTRAPGT